MRNSKCLAALGYSPYLRAVLRNGLTLNPKITDHKTAQAYRAAADADPRGPRLTKEGDE